MSAVRPRVAAAGALALALTAGYLAQGTYAAGTPANKVAASGSSTEVIGANESKVILSETVKINNPTDLILGVSLECSIMTQVTNSANGQMERAFGEITVAVKINGRNVPVADKDTDNGNVVFCNRAQEQQWTNSPNSNDGDDKDRLRQYLDTRTATAFNWLALNIGREYGGTQNNIHKIEVVATWRTEKTSGALAEARVGNRTLVLEPVKAANDERVTELG